jgi:hypothetical protein
MDFSGPVLLDSCRIYFDCELEREVSCPEDTPYYDYSSAECVVEEDVFCFPGSSKA